MHTDYLLPTQTIHDLAALVAHLVRLTWNATKRFVRMIAPFVRPPDDLEVRTWA